MMPNRGKAKGDYCQACDVLYSDTRRPRVLNCGHSLCSSCLTSKITTKVLSCPFCSAEFRAASLADIPINYSLESCISAIRKMRPSLAPEATQPEQRSFNVQELIDYQKQSAQDLLLSSKDLAEDLTKYRDFLNKNLKEHEEARRMIQDRADEHRTISHRLHLEQGSVMEEKKKLDTLIEKLRGVLRKLDNIYLDDEVAAGMTSVTNLYRELASSVDSCQEDYPDFEINIFRKVLASSMNIIYGEDFEYVKGGAYVRQCPFEDPRIMEKLKMCRIECIVKVDNLKSDVETWKERIRRYKLVAVSWDEGRRRMAYIKKKDDKIYLDCLYDGFPHPGNYVITHKEILTCVKSDPTVVFLEITWDYETKGRIHIELCPDNPLAQHFKGLCTGELGPTYLKMKLNNVVHPGSVAERITSGPCKGSFFHGDISQDTLGFNSAMYKCQADQGIIWMDTSLSFSILTGVGRGCIYNNVFGQVTDGLDLLLSSAKRIKQGLCEVAINNIGVILDI
ncbi:uncharacterized protein [Macrobrachium rosenbergii]|uniref:uncharacterized protein isoform X1 n=2 Tax=Macrobrachium rosenbergii TaxID=79674 RepID=UPI0034D4CDDA